LLERISRTDFSWDARVSGMRFHSDMSEEIPEDAENKVEYCENCGKEMALKRGRFGAFWLAPVIRIARRRGAWWLGREALTSDNRWTRNARWTETAGEKAREVWGVHRCSGYPSANTRGRSPWASSARSAMKANCEARSMGKGGRGKIRVFYGCSVPGLHFTTPFMPMAEPCPKCGAPFIVEKKTKIGTCARLP